MSHVSRFLTLGVLAATVGFLLAGCSNSSEQTATGPSPNVQASVADTKVPEDQRDIAKQAAQKQAEMNAMRERDAANADKTP